MMRFLEEIKKYHIVLASASPRRHYLLKGLGVDFVVQTVDVEEKYPSNLKLDEVAVYLAELKSNAFPKEKMPENTLLITADTIVIQDNTIVHKPKDREEAVEMLNKLSNSMHEVITGVCIRSLTKKKSFSSKSAVFFNKLSQEEIEYYVDNYKPYDKAGAYGIQEWIGYIGIRHIEGSYFNVMGLPTQTLYRELIHFIGN
jgi:septum formation protein